MQSAVDLKSKQLLLFVFAYFIYLICFNFRDEDKFALIEKNENSRILNFVKSPKFRNSRKFKPPKITRSAVYKRSEDEHKTKIFLKRDYSGLVLAA